MEDELLSEEEQKELYPHSDTLGVNERHVDFSKAWDSARTVQDWRNPVDVAAAGTARALEFIVPQSQEEWMLEMATLGQGKKLNLGRKLAHAAVKDIPVIGDFYAKGTAYMSNKLDNWFSSPRSEGPFPAWQSQDVPQTKLSSEISDLSKKHDVQFSESAPEPDWHKTPRPDEKKIWMDRFTDEVLIDEKGKHISKRTEDGYKFLGKFRAEWNAWSKDERFIRELADKPATAYVEHLVRKAKGMDWFWNLPNEVRFRKGSRHSPNNVRILYDNRYKSLKDATETILYNELQVATDPMNRLVIDLDIPKMKGKSITYKQPPKDLVIKRVDGTIVGRIGDYHDILYAPDNPKLVGKENTLSYKLGTNINPRTGRPYINLNTTPESIAEQVTMWRSSILRDKLQLIIDEAPTLKGKTKIQKTEYQSSAILEDMDEFLNEYSFIGVSKKFRRTLKKEPFQSARGGKPVKRPEDKLEGIFMNKDQERRARRNMYRRTWIEDDLNKIIRDE